MISGSRVMIFSQDAKADRIFLRDMLDLPCIDSGGHWLIFKLPPAELGVHGGTNGFHQLYLICDDLDATIGQLAGKGVEADPVAAQDWGRSTGIALPGGGKIGIYEAHHARPQRRRRGSLNGTHDVKEPVRNDRPKRAPTLVANSEQK